METAQQIKPVSPAQQQQIIAACEAFIDKASQLYGQSFSAPEIVFDLKGKAAGMYQVRKHGGKIVRKIRINPWIATKYFDETLNDTVPHEVAHFIADCLHGLSKIRPHGPEWKAIMRDFRVAPQVRGDYSLAGIPVKNYRRIEYACQCQTHQLTLLRHKKILHKKARYLCRSCGEQLVMA